MLTQPSCTSITSVLRWDLGGSTVLVVTQSLHRLCGAQDTHPGWLPLGYCMGRAGLRTLAWTNCDPTAAWGGQGSGCSRTKLNKSGKSLHLCLVLDLIYFLSEKFYYLDLHFWITTTTTITTTFFCHMW